jgi:hypothetical protein
VACSTADPPIGLTAVPLPTNTHQVLLNWNPPGQCQIRRYDVWRAVGSFTTSASVFANRALFTNITTNGINGTPPLTTFTDTNVKNNTTYTYFVTDKNKQGAQSGPSAASPMSTITVKF